MGYGAAGDLLKNAAIENTFIRVVKYAVIKYFAYFGSFFF